jgi:hypothetical protein
MVGRARVEVCIERGAGAMVVRRRDAEKRVRRIGRRKVRGSILAV